jgi:hypothetical protein
MAAISCMTDSMKAVASSVSLPDVHLCLLAIVMDIDVCNLDAFMVAPS